MFYKGDNECPIKVKCYQLEPSDPESPGGLRSVFIDSAVRCSVLSTVALSFFSLREAPEDQRSNTVETNLSRVILQASS